VFPASKEPLPLACAQITRPSPVPPGGVCNWCPCPAGAHALLVQIHMYTFARVGQDHIYVLYVTVYLVISLINILNIHRIYIYIYIYIYMANPNHWLATFGAKPEVS